MPTMISMLPAALIAVGFGVSILLSWTSTRDRTLTMLVAAAYLVRSVLAIALYAVSAWHAPLFQKLQIGGGFWAFARLAGLVLLYSVVLTAALGYAVPTVGVLFRLRLAVLVPLCILVGGGDLPGYVARLRNRLHPDGSGPATQRAPQGSC